MDKPQQNNKNIIYKEASWKGFLGLFGLHKLAIVIFSFLLLEFVFSHILILIVPDTLYLRAYLNKDAINHTYKVLNKQGSIELDSLCGWKNRANIDYYGIVFDKYRSRSFKGISEGKRKKWRIIFLGDSKINGYPHLWNYELVNAYIDCDSIETLNFGTVLYCLDQSLLALPGYIDKFSPDVVVICIGSEESALLDAHYIPFVREEISVPLLKPRFVIEGDSLRLIKPDYYALFQNFPDCPKLLEFLKANDPYYDVFQHYKLWGMTPLLDFCLMIKDFYIRMKGKYLDKRMNRINQENNLKNFELLKRLIEESQVIANKNNVRLIYLLSPRRNEYRNIELKAYRDIAELLNQLNIEYIDGLKVLQSYTGDEELFLDWVHPSKKANELYAEEIRKRLFPSAKSQCIRQ